MNITICVKRLVSVMLIMLMIGGGCMAESIFVSVDTLKNYYDVSKIDATIEELEAFIQDYEITSETVESYNIPLLLEDYIEESRKEISISEVMLTYDEALLLVELQSVEQVVSIAILEYSDGMLQHAYWDKDTSEFSCTKYVVESDEEPITEQIAVENDLILNLIRPFCEDNWPRLIQGTNMGHKLPYTYLLSIRYSDSTIAQYYICGEYEVAVPDDMQHQMDNLAMIFE